jgi:subtilisin family serine protease
VSARYHDGLENEHCEISLSLSALLTFLVALPAAAEGVFRRNHNAIPGSYIVGLKDPDGRNAAGHAAALANAHGGRVTAVYDSVLSGFAIELPEAAARALARNPKVRFVEEDAEGRISSLSASQKTSGDPEHGLRHLDRSDQRQVDNGGLDGIYGYCRTGQGVYAYIVDTGILADHAQVSGRVLAGVDFTEPEPDPNKTPEEIAA